jgi:predicted RNA-binding protein associated with RNAse of E/G family
VASTRDTVRIHYRRLPDRDTVFDQQLVHREPGCIVTYMPGTPLERPLVIDGRIVLENGSPVVWFTFPGEWHDIGRFHTADGAFTGIYANVLTPVEIVDETTWRTTDLFLDVWVAPGAAARVLDEDELNEAVAAGSITGELARRARSEADRLARLARTREWPPAIVSDWPIERIRHGTSAVEPV